VQLKTAANEEEFKSYLTAHFTHIASTQHDGPIYAQETVFDDTAAIAESTTSEANLDAGNTDNYSQTNTQVDGVDEGDIWKYDGENFFVLKPAQYQYEHTAEYSYDGCAYAEPLPATEIDSSSDSNNLVAGDAIDIMPCPGQQVLVSPAQVRIVKNNQQALANIELDEISPSEMYLAQNSLAVLGNKSSYQNNWSSMRNWQDGQTQVKFISVADKTAPAITYTIEIDGYVVQSRRIGDDIFLISRYSPSIDGIHYSPHTSAQVKQNQSLISQLSIEQLLPKITINGETSDLISAQTCLIPEVANARMGTLSLTMMSKININTAEFSSRCMAGDVNGIYMSQNNLYTFNTSYWDFSQNDISLTWHNGNTHLHKFDLSSFAYQGSSVIEGQLAGNNPRLRLGELTDGSIALVTSKKSTDNDWRLTQHQLTILNSQDNELRVISELPNEDQPAAIGKPNEEIYSVRFMQDRAYIVTFEKVDPLYVIDLADTQNPNIAGELEIPGYSDYLHPIANDLLLGVGKDAITGNSGTSWYQGIKVSLFNVAEIENPTELGNISIGKRGSNTPLSYDPLSFAGIQQDDKYRFAFPISVNNGAPHGNSWGDPESEFYRWSHSGLYLFEVKDNQLSNTGAMITVTSKDSQYPSIQSARGLIQADDVYYLNEGDLYKSNWNQPDEISEKF
jgi:uncharacterized secreted protein with C-terminal beta-propeller domain